MCSCLEQAVSEDFSHIAFPALGTGSLKFPLDVTAKVMIKCITQHESNFHDSTLTDVSIVVFDGDKNCRKVKSVSEVEQNSYDLELIASDKMLFYVDIAPYKRGYQVIIF